MKILFSLHDAGVGGGQRIAVQVAAAAVGRGHTAGLLVPAAGPASDEFAALDAETHLADMSSLRHPAAAIEGARTLAAYDILYSHTSVPGAVIGQVAALLARRVHVVHQHIYPHFSGRPAVGAAQKLLHRTLLRGARFIAVAEHVAESLRAVGVPPDRIEVVPNGTPLPPAGAHVRGDGPSLVVGLLGRLDRQKGADIFIEAARRAGLGERARFVVAGPPGPFAEYEEAIRAAAAAAGVAIVEPSEGGDVFLSRVDIVAMPSRYEGLPITLLEAMARSKPVVASAIPGIREVIEPEGAGILVPPEDPDALARAVASLVGDPALREELGRRARRVVETSFSADAMVERILAILEASLRGP